MEKIVRIGNAGGYWGDDPYALRRQLTPGGLDYISLDYLAEITMSILQKQKARDPELGYATDFVSQLGNCLPLLSGAPTRIISNAGGINPYGCAERIAQTAREAGIELKIAVVTGDELMPRLDGLIQKGFPLKNMETGQELSTVLERVVSANAYLGAAPVIRALELGARVVITGRVTDTGITLAAPAHEFEWPMDDWDRLASAIVAGHILECGAQASGGNLTDWRDVESFQDMGFPIAEISADGSFVVTKHEGSGGLVDRRTVSEQLVYEMGDPQEYITPDVVADFSSIVLDDHGGDRVGIHGVKGRPRTEFLKASLAYRDGYKAHGTLIVSRPDAVRKCQAIAEIFWKRLGLDFEARGVDLIGYNSCHRHLAPSADPPEILLRLGVRDPDRRKVIEFSRVFPSLILSSAPGVAIVGARPRLQEVVAYWPCLLPASEIQPEVALLGSAEVHSVTWTPPSSDASPKHQALDATPASESSGDSEQRETVPLSRIAYARSGDKGDTCNIGVVARSPGAYSLLRDVLTANRIKEFFAAICRGSVDRYEVPNLLALNFLLHESLGGGGTVSLGIDPQGKTYSQALLMMELEVPVSLLGEL